MLESTFGSGAASPSTSTAQTSMRWPSTLASSGRARAPDTVSPGVEAMAQLSQPPLPTPRALAGPALGEGAVDARELRAGARARHRQLGCRGDVEALPAAVDRASRL